jgi:phosphatidylglycerol:prolipoprotein diacylglycerol transferase
MNLEIFQIGKLTFHTYGLILGLAIVVGMWVAERMVEKYYVSKLLTKKDVERSAVWIVVFGVLGARLYHVIEFWSYYSKNFGEILALWNGGLGIYGAIFGGLLGGALYVRVSLSREESKKTYKEKFYRLLDTVSLGLPLSQAIGRLGNFVNQEIYGSPTNLPWGIYIQEDKRLTGYENYEYFQPLFLYEALWNLIGFLFLWKMMRNKRFVEGKGNYFILYLIWYGIGRAMLEPLRLWYGSIWGIPTASVIGVCIIVIGLIIIIKRRKNNEWKILVN